MLAGYLGALVGSIARVITELAWYTAAATDAVDLRLTRPPLSNVCSTGHELAATFAPTVEQGPTAP